MRSRTRRDLINDLLAPPLILTTPFVSFVNYNDYGFSRMEIWLVLGGMIALGLLCGAVMTLGGQWARIILTAGLVTLFVDFQFDWLDQQPEFRVPAFGIGMLLVSWLLRAQLSQITTPVFATMLVATVAFPSRSADSSFGHPDQRVAARTTPEPAPPIVVHLMNSSAWQEYLRFRTEKRPEISCAPSFWTTAFSCSGAPTAASFIRGMRYRTP
jgi:hypothetical protein